MAMNTELIGILGTLCGITFGGVATWLNVRSRVKQTREEWRDRLEGELQRDAENKVKAYAAERDFQHIKRNYEQALEAMKDLQHDIDENTRTLIEVKALVLAISNRLEGLTARLDGNTGGWGRRGEG
jgi:chromosome segregation ATPase